MAPASPLAPFPWIDVVIILVLVAVNGVFAMTEMAVASSREARGGPVAARLELTGMSHDTAGTVGFVVVIGLTTFVSLIIGELVPKQFALRSPEPIAAVMAIPMTWLSRIAAPLVWLLDSTSGLLFRLIGMSRESDDQVTAEEFYLIVAEASKSGVIEEHECSIISGVVRLADRPVREVMTPRTEVDWLDSSLDDIGIRAKLASTQHTRLPVADGSGDAVIGVVQARDIVAAAIKGEPRDLKVLMRAAPVVIDQLDAMDALVRLRRAPVPMALIHDEYGHFEGIGTPADLLAAIAGEFASDADPDEFPDFVHRDDGSFLVAGSASADMLAEKLDLDLPDDRDYATAAGFALAAFRRLPNDARPLGRAGQAPRERRHRGVRSGVRKAGLKLQRPSRVTSNLSMRRPSRSITSKTQPCSVTLSPSLGRRRNAASAKPAAVA